MSMSMESNSKILCHIQSLIGGRDENQDYAGCLETSVGTVVVVCDGMGALRGGSTASRIAVTTTLEEISKAKADDNVSKVLETAVRKANDAVIDAAEADEDLTGMGTTLTAVIINDECATVTHLGDSRVYQLRGRKKVFRTYDHSLVFQSVRTGLITEEQARLASNSNVITKALGISREIEVEISELPYLKGDRFVLCTDGFWGAMPEKTLLSHISKGNISTTLEKTALKVDMMGKSQGGHHDNLTVAMLEVQKESKRKINMTKKVKCILVSVIILLIASLALNVYQYKQNHKQSEKPSKTENVKGETKVEETKKL